MSAWSLLGAAPALAAGPPVIEAGPPVIEGESVLDVKATSATLQARIDPEGNETDYRFEYGTSEAYRSRAPEQDGAVGSGSSAVTVSSELEGLAPGTTYHYRVAAIVPSTEETFYEKDGTFTTPLAGGEFSLLDGRQWELVSPPNKHGATIYPLGENGVPEAADNGSAITYLTNAPIESEPKGAYSIFEQMLSRRGAEGWLSQDIVTPHDEATGLAPGIGFEYQFFSSDLSLALVEPQGDGGSFTPLSPQATERTPYVRNDLTCAASPSTCYDPLVTSADVRPGAKFGGEPERLYGEAEFAGATPDLSHVLIDDGSQGLTSTPGDNGGVYEWPPAADGELQLVSVLPAGEGGAPANRNASLGGYHNGRHYISDDGSRVFWRTSPAGNQERLYLRDMSKGETLRIGNANWIEFQIANSDGSRVFFAAATEFGAEETLEVCDVVEVLGKLACETTALAAGFKGDVLGISEDGSYVYFVSTAALAANAEEHQDNLYVDHSNGTTWEPPRLIATLPQEDENDWGNSLSKMTARVSPNGMWLAFMSRKRLTGYDNSDAVSGEPDEEVYLYHAAGGSGEEGRLVCASCDPTGARPVGMEYGDNGDYYEPTGLLGGGDRVWPTTTWLAANIPGWTRYSSEGAGAFSLYQPRYLSDSGRLFFNSDDALVPQDVNGTWDVYEYEPEGVGSCGPASGSGSVVYKPEREAVPGGAVEPAGCVGLLTSGESPEQSAFMDASENGNDVFVLTTSQLAPQDVDTYPDIYDAHVCSTAVPCPSSVAAAPPCDTTDSCRAAPSSQPEVFGAPASATFSGEGNKVVKSTSVKPAGKSNGKSSARARKRRCDRLKLRQRRASCERRARKRYGQAAGRRRADGVNRGGK